MSRPGMSRRKFVVATAAAATAAAAGALAWRHYDDFLGLSQGPTRLIPSDAPLALSSSGKLLDTDFPDPFAGGQLLGYFPFELEAIDSPLVPGQKMGEGHNSR